MAHLRTFLVFILFLKLVVSNGEIESGSTETKNSDHQVEAPHSTSKLNKQNQKESSEESSSESNSDEEGPKKFSVGNTQTPNPNTSRKNGDSLPIKKNEAVSTQPGQLSSTPVSIIEEHPATTPDQQHRKRKPEIVTVANEQIQNKTTVTTPSSRIKPETVTVANEQTQDKVTVTTPSSQLDAPPKKVLHDLQTIDRGEKNTEKPLVAPSHEVTTSNKPPSNNLPVRQSNGVTNLENQRTEKSLRMDATDTTNSVAGPVPTGPQEPESNQNSTKEREIGEIKKSDAESEPILKNEQTKLLETTASSSAPKDAPTQTQVKDGANSQFKSTKASTPSPSASKSDEQSTSTAIQSTPTEPPSKDTAGSPPPHHYTTTFFHTLNSTDEFENSSGEFTENHDKRIVVTDRAPVGQPIMDDTDLASFAHNIKSTGDPFHPSMNDDTVKTRNATLTDSENASNPKIIFPEASSSPGTPSESPITEIGMKDKTPSSETPTSPTPVPESTKPTSSRSNTTDGKNATGLPPVNTPANNNSNQNQTMSIEQFFSQLKVHTVLCIISLALIFLTITVIVSLIIVVYYLIKYAILGLISLCRRMGLCGCSKRKKSLGTIPEGSLFPRCDVNVSPYVQHASIRNSRNGLDTEMYS